LEDKLVSISPPAPAAPRRWSARAWPPLVSSPARNGLARCARGWTRSRGAGSTAAKGRKLDQTGRLKSENAAVTIRNDAQAD